MSDLTASQLVRYLRTAQLRNRTGILLVLPAWLGREKEIATRLGVGFEDERELVLRRLPSSQRFIERSWKDIITKDIDNIVRNSRQDGGCVLIANVDIILSSFIEADRLRFWEFLFDSYKPSKRILLTLPNITQRLLPDIERSRWIDARRLADWPEGEVKL